MPLRAQGFVKALAAKAGVAGDLRHAVRPRDNAQGIGNERWITDFKGLIQIRGNRIGAIEVVGRVEGFGLERHGYFVSNSAAML